MTIEAGFIKQEEEKEEKKVISEKEQTFEKFNQIDREKNLDKNSVEEASSKELFELSEMLDAGIYDEATSELIKKVIESSEISQEEVEEIFTKIEEMQEELHIGDYLQSDLVIQKGEYQRALSDPDIRKTVLIKLDKALAVISAQISPSHGATVNLFSGFLAVLDKNLVSIQETHIDIKHSLKKVEGGKSQKNMTLWERIVSFFRELLK